MNTDNIENKYNIFRELNIIQKQKGYIAREHIEEVFNLDKYDSETLLKSFWKCGILEKRTDIDFTMPNRFVFSPKYAAFIDKGEIANE